MIANSIASDKLQGKNYSRFGFVRFQAFRSAATRNFSLPADAADAPAEKQTVLLPHAEDNSY